MSRHHVLPPIIYALPPRPKKIQSRKSRVQLRSTGIVPNSSEIDETEETSGLDRPTPVAYKPPMDSETAIKGSGRKPKSTTRLIGRRYPEGNVAGAGTGEIDLPGSKLGFVGSDRCNGNRVSLFTGRVRRARGSWVTVQGRGNQRLAMSVLPSTAELYSPGRATSEMCHNRTWDHLAEWTKVSAG